jgi:hypothetical protein
VIFFLNGVTTAVFMGSLRAHSRDTHCDSKIPVYDCEKRSIHRGGAGGMNEPSWTGANRIPANGNRGRTVKQRRYRGMRSLVAVLISSRTIASFWSELNGAGKWLLKMCWDLL